MMEATTAKCVGAREIHCLSVMSSMWDLRSRNEFCDVAIVVDDKTFLGHRHVLSAACEYFHAMFAGGFEESSVPKVTLHGVDPNTFETILRFIYTGYAGINASNACALIDAAQFYGLATLEAHLVEFARRTSGSLSSEDVLKMFTGAHTQGLKNLFKYLSDYIYRDFGFFSDSPEFVNTTWGSLMGLAADGLASSADGPILSDTFVEGVLKWIRGQVDASADERGSCFEQFVSILRPTKSFADEGIQHLLERYRNAEQAPSAVAVFDERPRKLLRAFVQRAHTHTDCASMFTLHETKAGLAWAYSGEFGAGNMFMKNFVMDDSWYSFVPAIKNGPGVRFSLHRRAYAHAPHVSWFQRQDLKQPPCIMSRIDMCGMYNHIFAYDKAHATITEPLSFFTFPYARPIPIPPTHRDFVFSYKRDLDQWFSLPPPHKYRTSCMTCDDRIVYLIGGTDSNAAVQGYDQRTRAWMDLPSTDSVYEDAACCIRDGKIWVVGGKINPSSVEIFDPTAGKWERGKSLIEGRPGNSQLVNWNSVKYGSTVVSFRDNSPTEDIDRIFFSDDGNTSGWNTIPALIPPWTRRPPQHRNHIADDDGNTSGLNTLHNFLSRRSRQSRYHDRLKDMVVF